MYKTVAMSAHLVRHLDKLIPLAAAAIGVVGSGIAWLIRSDTRSEVAAVHSRVVDAENAYLRKRALVQGALDKLGLERLSIVRRLMPRVVTAAERLNPSNVANPLGDEDSLQVFDAAELARIRATIDEMQDLERLDRDDPLRRQLLLQGALTAVNLGAGAAAAGATTALANTAMQGIGGLAAGLGVIFAAVDVTSAVYERKSAAEKMQFFEESIAQYGVLEAKLVAVAARIMEIQSVTDRLAAETFRHAFMVTQIAEATEAGELAQFYGALGSNDKLRVQFFYIAARGLWTALSAPIVVASGDAANDPLPMAA